MASHIIWFVVVSVLQLSFLLTTARVGVVSVTVDFLMSCDVIWTNSVRVVRVLNKENVQFNMILFACSLCCVRQTVHNGRVYSMIVGHAPRLSAPPPVFATPVKGPLCQKPLPEICIALCSVTNRWLGHMPCNRPESYLPLVMWNKTQCSLFSSTPLTILRIISMKTNNKNNLLYSSRLPGVSATFVYASFTQAMSGAFDLVHVWPRGFWPGLPITGADKRGEWSVTALVQSGTVTTKQQFAVQLYCVVLCLRTVPAAIIEHLSSNDVTVQEGDTVVLVCNVTGVPAPEVTWFRRPASSAASDRERKSYWWLELFRRNSCQNYDFTYR